MGAHLHLAVLALPVLAAFTLSAGQEGTFFQAASFEAPAAVLTPEGFTRVSVPGCDPDGQTGRPVLPVRRVWFELPAGAEVTSVTLAPEGVREIPLSAPVEWAQPPVQPDERPAAHVPPDPDVYGGATPFPDLASPRWRADPTDGKQLVSILVPPVRYDPSRQALLSAASVGVTVRFLVRPAPPVLAAPEIPSPLPPGTYTYAVVAPDALLAAPGPWNLQALCEARARAGFTPAQVSAEWIDGHYEGTNRASRIRAFAQDAYRTWGLRYLLLAGTFETIPVQRLYISFNDFFYVRTAEIPADALYFGCMDGTFDNNGNGRFGELTDGLNGGDIDLTAEVLVGRFPVANAAELAHMVRKTLRYERATARELRPQAFLAEKVNLGTLVYSDGYMEELRFGATNNGLSAVGFKASGYAEALDSDFTLYDSDAYIWDTADALAYLNRNLATVNHMGHGAVKHCLKIPLTLTGNQTALAAFTNELPYFIYSQACSSGAFDTPDCFAEQVVTVSNAAFAAVMNAREGWEYPNVVGGFSHRYHRAFWDAALSGGATRLGEINEQSRRKNLHLVSNTTANYWRWVYYELNLFGDPATPFVPAVNLTPPAIAHTPLVNTYDTQTAYRVTCTVEPAGLYDPDGVFLVWSTDRDPAVRTQAMAQVSGNLFEAFIDAQPARTRVAYTLSARTFAGVETRSPSAGEQAFYVTERLTLTVLGSPSGFGSPDPAYGTYSFASGLVASASAPLTVGLDAETRVSNIGYFGTGSAPQSGTNQSVSFRMDTSSLLAWMWRTDYRLSWQANIDAVPPVTAWVPKDSAYPVPSAPEQVTATGGAAFAFAEWRVDGARTPPAPGLSSPAFGTLAMDAPHTLTAIYLPAAQDEDANGIADWWETRYFGASGNDPQSDHDGDGFTLYEEYLDRASPLSAAESPAPPAIAFSPLAETQARPGPFTVRATLTDTHRIESAYLVWHRRTEPWQQTPLLLTSNNVFEAQFATASAPGDDFEYQIVATDPTGRSSQTEVHYLFLRYPVADTSRFHDLALVALPTQLTAGAYMNLHNTGNADLVWTCLLARADAFVSPSLPTWNTASLGQPWSVSTNRSASPPYALHSRLVSSGQSAGPAVHATVAMPPTLVGPDAVLSFRYWIHSEPYGSTTRAFDGGIVEFSSDGGATFQQLKGPYTHTIYGWTYSPWTNGTPCFAGNGTEGWRTARFDLAGLYPDENGFRGRTLIVRFHYGADNNTDNEGWYIDDVSLSPMEWPQGFVASLTPPYSFTLPAGANTRILWSILPAALARRDDSLTVCLLSNDPVSPSFNFRWDAKLRDVPHLSDLQARQSSDGDGRVSVSAALSDSDGEPVSLTFDWSDDGGKTWRPAAFTNVSAQGLSPSGSAHQVSGLLTATNGLPVTNRLAAVWETRAVTPALGVCTQTLLRLSATNGYFGKAYATARFTVDNEPPAFGQGGLAVAPLSTVGPYALTDGPLFLSWPAARDTPSTALVYRVTDDLSGLPAAPAVTGLTAQLSATLSLSNALNRTHRFEVTAFDPSGNASAPLSSALQVLDPAADFDGDGLGNADEETAGTLANDPSQRFTVGLSAASGQPGRLSLVWPSVAGRLYTVESTPALQPAAWAPEPGLSELPGSGGLLSVELPEPAGTRFYRLRVRLP